MPPTVVVALVALAVGLRAQGSLAAWCLFPALGVFPGVAVATLLPLERGAFARWALGIAASPLVATAASWAIMRAGMSLHDAAIAVAIAGTAAWLAAEMLGSRGEPAGPSGSEGLRFAWGWSLGAAAVIGFVMFVNPQLQTRADGWIHGGIVYEIMERGIPPQDPRFAGLTLNYVWFHNFFIALLCSLRNGSPFALLAIANVASMFATMAIVWLVARKLWTSSRAAAGAALLTGLGLNAGMWLLWPLRLVRALFGNLRGADEVARLLRDRHWNEADVIYDLGVVGGQMVSFLDKPLHGTAINVAYAFLLLYLWAMVLAMQDRRGPALTWAALATSGMFLFHGVVGMSVAPVAMAALGLAWLLRGRWDWLPSRGRLGAVAFATTVGVALAAPYTIAISRAWPASRSGLQHSYLQLDWPMWITLVSSLAVPAWFARRSVARMALERRGPAALIALYVACMLVFASVVTLPLGSHVKFVIEAFVGITVLGGVAFHDELASWSRRFGRAGAVAIAAIVLAGTPLITLRGFLLDRSGARAPENNPAPGEDDLYAWMRTRTPADAVFVDYRFRNIAMVRAKRQLLLGSELGPELAAFPLGEVLRRRALMHDLYGRADSLDRDAAALGGLGRPVYVLLRPADMDSTALAAARLSGRPELFERVYDRNGFIVYHVVPRAGATAP